jgi:hypothetical protein
MNLWARNLAAVDPVLEIQVCIRLDASGCAKAGDTASQIEPRKREALPLLKLERSPDTRAFHVHRLRIKHVIVHPDDTGENGVIGEVENLRLSRR